ncbi:unnamed protein product [Calicophoron daubneyi]|uniref:MARVEL domain-containing protein n=1 Tax=Calicophoron daubneyi TaxID=300641 RepID=A0AAV2TBB6_CALDB
MVDCIHAVILLSASAAFILGVIPLCGVYQPPNWTHTSLGDSFYGFTLIGVVCTGIVWIAAFANLFTGGGELAYDAVRITFSVLAAASFIIAVACIYHFAPLQGNHSLPDATWLFGAMTTALFVMAQSVEAYKDH